MKQQHVALVLEVIGAAAVTLGVAMVSIPAACVVAGVLVLVFAIALQVG